MTQVSKDDVQHLAQLSNLQLTDEEVTRLGDDIEHILEYIQQLGELDTTGVEPTYQVTELQNIWREDTINTYGLNGGELVNLAPDNQDNQIKVPKVL